MAKLAKLLAQPLVLLVKLYQLVISPMLPPSCRFYPSCSHYSVEALQTHGVFKGSWLTVWRIVRCNPFHPGGYEPVPPASKHIHPAEETPKGAATESTPIAKA